MDADIEPLYAWLGSDAGTEKSRVIHALLTLASTWQWPNAVMVVALMEIAAMNAKGQTIHATFNFSLNNKPRST
jgi:hypothetical protein